MIIKLVKRIAYYMSKILDNPREESKNGILVGKYSLVLLWLTYAQSSLCHFANKKALLTFRLVIL